MLYIHYNNTRKKQFDVVRDDRRPMRQGETKNYMTETHEFLVPDYFKHFSCKMGACRSACCQGWPISITMKNYFTLLGLDCGAELRDRLDRSMHMVDRPTEDEYAQFSMRWDGECALRLPDGRCSLHAELGPELLSDVCDLYPRGIRTKPSNECSCAGSCEAVLELLIRQKEPMTFSVEPHALRMPRPEKRLAKFETLGRETEIRLFFIRVMQERSYSLPQRLAKLGDSVYRMDAALQKKDAAQVEDLLKNGVSGTPAMDTGAVDTEHLLHGLGIYAPLMRALAEENILCVLAEMPFNLAVFDVDAASDYSDRYPQTERWFIGGHSLGGSMAASHAAKHPGDYEGLALLAAYSTADLKDVGLDVLSVYGSEDRVLSMEKYEKYRTNLPENTVESVIEGGCHAGFGLYGPQDGDGTPSIPAEEQIQRTASLITEMIFNQ